ncbi:unnamed protein product, partial [Urochloa humidicola]
DISRPLVLSRPSSLSPLVQKQPSSSSSSEPATTGAALGLPATAAAARSCGGRRGASGSGSRRDASRRGGKHGENTHDNPPLSIHGPITRARARQLNLEVSSFLSTSLYEFKNKLLPNDCIMIRNQGEDKEMHGERL